jgi:hypothetical protein
MYQYTALGPEGSNFRLLRLLKGSGRELECELSPHSLQNVHPPYEALSYTWGSNELVECITLDRKPFWITDNLHSVLQCLRLCDRDRILWIDAVCINQEDKVEQSQQVQQMAQIFEKAEKVLFWLGKATPQMISLMETLDRFRNIDPGCYHKQETIEHPSWEDHSIAIKQIFNREWFTRVWILQEVAKARRADVCCGRRSIPAEIFVLAPSLIKQEPPRHCKPVLDIMAELSRSNSWWAQTRNLRTLVQKFQSSKATDERDKIYALLGMSSDPLDTKNLPIDYRRPTSQVVHEAMTYFLRSTQTNQWNSFTIEDVLNLMCSFATLDVTYFVPEQEINWETSGHILQSEHKRGERDQIKFNPPAIAVVNDPTLLLFEERPAEGLENQKTCYDQIVQTMLDQQSSRAPPDDFGRGLHVFSWGNAQHHVKVVVVYDKAEAIVMAATRECDQLIRRLLCMEIGVEGEDEEECEAIALQTVIRDGHESALRLMLDAGADVNAQGGEYGNALQAAALGDEEIVKILLNAGADVNAQGGEYGNALQAAAVRSNKETIKMLLYAGADVNAQGGYCGNALQAAAAYARHKEIVEILLNAGADVNAQGGQYGTALQAAALGDEEIVKILLNAGADVNIQGGHYGNALQTAVIRGKRGIVKILLNAGADVNAQGGKYKTALQAATSSEKEEIVQILLEAGAVANAPDVEQDRSPVATYQSATSL